MEASIKPINQIPLLCAEQALERIFAAIDSPTVKGELFKWFAFGLTGKGKTLSDLNTEELGILMDKFFNLIPALYTYHLEIQKGADK